MKKFDLKYTIRRFFSFFKFSNLQREMATMGTSLTLNQLFRTVLLLLLLGFISGYLMKLEPLYTAMVFLSLVGSLPLLLLSRAKMDNERRRFDDVVNYMEQLIYSFKKNGKIRQSLVDVREVTTGNIRRIVERMIDSIDFYKGNADIYKHALSIIESEYKCYRMYILHSFLISVEENGGDPSKSLDILLDDVRSWSERTLVYQTNRKKSRNDVTLSLFLAMLSCGIMINLMPAEYVNAITTTVTYQIGTAGVLIACVVLFIVASIMVGASYLDMESDGDSSEKAIEAMEYVSSFNERYEKNKKPERIMASVFFLLSIGCVFLGLWFLTPLFLATAVLMLFHSTIKRNQCVNSILHEVKKMFPTWMRNLVLLLQTDNVHVAIRKSYDDCPAILKPELRRLINNIAADPVSMKPFSSFLKDFDVPTLKLSVNYLYSMANMGSEGGTNQLDYLIEQNSKLSIVEEDIRNDEKLGGFSILVYMPMLLAVVKLCIDLVLLIGQFMGQMGTAMSDINF